MADHAPDSQTILAQKADAAGKPRADEEVDCENLDIVFEPEEPASAAH